MQIIDLSHPIVQGMPLFPNTPPIEIHPIADVESQGFAELSLNITTHTGTHIDAQAHVIAQGACLDDLSVNAFIGSALVVDCRDRGKKIDGSMLKGLVSLAKPVDFVLLWTGWDKYWGYDSYYSGFPTLTLEAAKRLAELPLKGVGVDGPSLDPVDSSELAAHHMLLHKGILIVENLTNLDKLPEAGSIFSCLPLKVRHGDGSPVRAVGMIDCAC